jgi:hypothetical protein
MIMHLLAQTGGTGDGLYISVAAITVIGVAIAAAIKAFKAGVQRGKEAQDNNVTLKKPVPTIQTREEPAWATKPELFDHIGWTREEFNKVWMHFETERGLDNVELTKIHERINQQSMMTSSLKGTVENISETVTQLLHLALHGKTPPRPRQ